MKKNQKYCFISHVLVFGGISISLLSILFLLIHCIVFKNYEANYVHLIFFVIMVIGIIIPFHAPSYNPMYHIGYYTYPEMKLLRSKNGLIEGVPNNCYDEFRFTFKKQFNQNRIEIVEVDQGIYEGTINEKTIRFDMKNWIRKRYYIYEYFMTKLQLETNDKKTKQGFLMDNTFSRQSELILIIKNNKNKSKKYNLVIAGKTKPSFMFKYRFRQKWGVIGNIEKKSIETFYNFNK